MSAHRRPQGRQDSARKRGARGWIVAAVCGVLAVVLSAAFVPGTFALPDSVATAKSKSFKSAGEFTPRISTDVSCKTNRPVLQSATVTLTWKSVGPKYDYRILVRDFDGNVHGTWDVSSTAAVGSNVSKTIDAGGFATHGVTWQYDAEIHTVLRSSGEISAQWAGYGVYQDLLSNNLKCSPRGKQDGSTTPPAPPATPTNMACETTELSVLGLGLLRGAKLSWEDGATPPDSTPQYRVIVKNTDKDKILYQADTSSTSMTIRKEVLDLSGLLNPSTFYAYVYGLDEGVPSDDPAGPEELTTNLVGTGLTGIGCASDNPQALRAETPADTPGSGLGRALGDPTTIGTPATSTSPTTTSPTGTSQAATPSTESASTGSANTDSPTPDASTGTSQADTPTSTSTRGTPADTSPAETPTGTSTEATPTTDPPTTTASPTTPTTTDTTTPPPPATSSPSTAKPTSGSPTTTTTTPPPTTTSATPTETPLTTPTTSNSGYTAVIMRTGSEHDAVITDASGDEVARRGVDPGATLRWDGAHLWVTPAGGDTSNAYYLDGDHNWAPTTPEPTLTTTDAPTTADASGAAGTSAAGPTS